MVGVVGGSISCGHGAVDAPGWVQRVEKFLQDAYGKDSPLSEWDLGDISCLQGCSDSSEVSM